MVDAEWPVWATEAVEIVLPDPTWQARGQRQCLALEHDLAPWLVSSVEHIGSTSVPDLAAKPILDFQAKVNDLGCVTEIAPALASGGWHLIPKELEQRPRERLFVEVVQDRRRAHLHLMEPIGPQWADRIAFRDALCSDSSLVADDTRLKSALAITHPKPGLLLNQFLLRPHAQHLTSVGVLQRPTELNDPLRDTEPSLFTRSPQVVPQSGRWGQVCWVPSAVHGEFAAKTTPDLHDQAPRTR